MTEQRQSALTITGAGKLDRITSDVSVCAAFDPQKPPDELPPRIETRALWDTGATKSSIAINLVEELTLTPVGQVTVHHGAISHGQRNNSASFSDGFIQPSVCRGRSLSMCATRFRCRWLWTDKSLPLGKY